MISNLAVACRGLRRSPAFTLAAILTLALGIGANTAMFSVVNAVLLRPLPGYETDRLVRITEAGREGRAYVPPEVYPRLREALHSFTEIAANQNCRMNFTGRGEPEQLAGPCTTANWFELHRARALLGRTFLPDEDQHGRNRVVVLDYGYWQRRFGGDPKIIGQALVLDQEPWLVVGVMPPGFQGAGMEAWPIYAPYVVADNPHGLNVTARLRPGVSLAAAQAELNVVAGQLSRENPDWKALKLRATAVLEEVTGPQRPMLLLLLGAVSLVLLMACVNVTNLFLARAAGRRQEIEIRLALGARRWHIARLVAAEALVIAATASAAAVLLAYGALRVLRAAATDLARAGELSIDARVLACALVLGAASAVLAGGLPAWRSFRTLRVAGMRSRAGALPQRVLVAAEVALAFVLLAGAGLLLRTFLAIRSTDLGYNPQNVLTSFLALPPSADGSRTAGAALFARIRERIAALPGVRAVATASSIPMFGVSISMTVQVEGEPERPREHAASMDVVSNDYFRVMEIPLRAGRGFTPADRDGARRVVVISQSIADRYLGGKALGRRLVVPEVLFNVDGGQEFAAEIVGVAGNVCVNSADDCQAEHIYLPESQNALRMENLLVRTEGDPAAMIATARRAVYVEAPMVPLDSPQTLEARTGYLVSAPRRGMWLLGVFAALATALAAVGIYGVSAYLASGRSREVAIRMALGAGPADIAGLMYRSGLLPSALGLGAGMAAAAGVTRLLRSLLFRVSPGDPRTLALAGLLLLAVSLAAATAPAIRAALTDPARVLRRE
jgi:putative ABC transport system permease protein